MTSPAGSSDDSPWLNYRLLSTLTVAAVGFGVYARFKGLGTWPFGADEFYISRSIDNVLRSGLPEFLCGGYYTRGLLYQYFVAALRLGGLSPELASRLVSAVASLAVLPAAYLLGRRLQGKTVGLIAVIVLALSVWEVEMARFARMYAPFQAVFAWYLLFFFRYTVDRARSALPAMILLSVVGVLTWEGGVLIALANLLPPFINHDKGRLRRGDWIYLAAMTALFVVLYAAVTVDLRGFADVPAGADSGEDPDPEALWTTLGSHAGWSLLGLVPLGLTVVAARWVWGFRGRWIAACGLGLALTMALLHQVVACAAIVALMLLMGLISWRELTEYRARWFLTAIAASTIFWIAFLLFTDDWYGTVPGGLLDETKMIAIGSELSSFPDIVQAVVRPWGRTIPVLSVGLFAILAGLALSQIFGEHSRVTPTSSLVVLVFALVIAVGASEPPRVETRYAFFLYPAFVLLAAVGIARLCGYFIHDSRRAMLATSAASLLAFAATEDFQPRHLALIDSPEMSLRIGMRPVVASHYYGRGDLRALAGWLSRQVGPGDLVMIDVLELGQYYADVDFVFLDEQDPTYAQFACNEGRSERWNNLPLLYTTDALAPYVATGQRIFMVLYDDQQIRLIGTAAARGWRVEVTRVGLPGTGTVLILNP